MKKRAEKPSKVDKVDSAIEEEPKPKTADDYQCSGHLQLEFPELCKLMGVKEIPSVKVKRPRILESRMTKWSPGRCLQIELENEEHNNVKEVKISGWTVDELMLQVLSKILPSLSNLLCLRMWRIGLTDGTFTSMKNTVSLCSNLRKVVLEGNPLPEQSYHLLLGEDSMLTELSLRNNRIGEEGARLIGSALSNPHSANKNLRSLNLAYNRIGDAGALHIAQGLRLNRSLLSLSLSYNHIGDNGAARLAEVLGPFALTHEEIVERRKLLIKGDQSNMVQSSLVSLADSHEPALSVPSNSSLDQISKSAKHTTKKRDNPKKEEKPAQSPAAKKEEAKVAKKDNKAPRSQAGKGKDKNLLVSEQEGTSPSQAVEVTVDTVIPLLDPGIVHTGGKVIHPGNTCLTSLNLSGNELSEQSLKVFLSSLESQCEGGLLRLSLSNRFPSDCDTFLKIQEMMSQKHPLSKNSTSQMEDEYGEAKTSSPA
ncbi:leucine-rich repeat-containing protein 71 isoform X1 [Danio rerio]|uniref:Leucine-rich repeat-containing protein 71 isoform X1 n=4 Tax=Danio rerio TaxID=7955 RepID=A0A8M3AVD0_DANRE|nr:leucine-rich repeat-containing protein 71 isoform X1 [Danio rerio]|eukprot:XP_009292320.1 leucine-rich repeat-containing protein 71 isoform X1 [Danio rerio]